MLICVSGANGVTGDAGDCHPLVAMGLSNAAGDREISLN